MPFCSSRPIVESDQRQIALNFKLKAFFFETSFASNIAAHNSNRIFRREAKPDFVHNCAHILKPKATIDKFLTLIETRGA